MLASSAFFRYPRNMNPISARRIKPWRNTCASQRLLLSLGRPSIWTSLSSENSRCSSYWRTVPPPHSTICQVLETRKYAVFRRIRADWKPWQGNAQGSAVHRCRGADHWRQLLFWRGKGLLLHASAAWSIGEGWLLPDIFQGPVSVPVALRIALAREIKTRIISVPKIIRSTRRRKSSLENFPRLLSRSSRRNIRSKTTLTGNGKF